MILLPELLTHPTRHESDGELAALSGLLAHLVLLPVDPAVAELAVILDITYPGDLPDQAGVGMKR